ncbi:MAG: hypothetical protein JNM56_12335 [Planctomycetia bacterium]|nr:hypothetical protein [Planctomycetia bacterium]
MDLSNGLKRRGVPALRPTLEEYLPLLRADQQMAALRVTKAKFHGE